MNILRPLKVSSVAFFFATAAIAQQPGTVTNHAFVIGKGAGQTGFTSLLCDSAQLAVGQAAADPICRTMSGDATLSAAGAISIGATKVTSAMLNADVFSTAHSWSGQQSFLAPILGTPASGTLTNATGLPIATGVAGLGTGVATFLATPSSANLRAALTDESGTGAALFAGGDLGTPSAGVLTNATGLPIEGVASIPANTLVGNFTGSSSSPTATNPATFVHKASPTTSDILIIADVAASNTIKHATIAEVIGAIGSGVTSLNGQTGALSAYFPPQGRLTLTSGTPVLTATTNGLATVYYTPYVGDLVPIYDGTNVIPTVFAELSQATTDTTKSPAAAANNSNYDIFVWNDGGTIRATRGPAWTNDTTRSAGTALVRVRGLLLNNASITNGPAAQRGTYVGTIRTNGAAQVDYQFGSIASGWHPGNFGVWNAYNRVRVTTTTGDSTDLWTHTVANTWRAPNGNATARVSAIRGLNEDGITATYSGFGGPGAASVVASGIGLNSTTAYSGTTSFNTLAGTAPALPASYAGLMGLGYVFVSAIEYNTTTTAATWVGDSGVAYIQSGMTVTLMQ